MERKFGNVEMNIPESVDKVMLESLNQVSGDYLELP